MRRYEHWASLAFSSEYLMEMIESLCNILWLSRISEPAILLEFLFYDGGASEISTVFFKSSMSLCGNNASFTKSLSPGQQSIHPNMPCFFFTHDSLIHFPIVKLRNIHESVSNYVSHHVDGKLAFTRTYRLQTNQFSLIQLAQLRHSRGSRVRYLNASRLSWPPLSTWGVGAEGGEGGEREGRAWFGKARFITPDRFGTCRVGRARTLGQICWDELEGSKVVLRCKRRGMSCMVEKCVWGINMTMFDLSSHIEVVKINHRRSMVIFFLQTPSKHVIIVQLIFQCASVFFSHTH